MKIFKQVDLWLQVTLLFLTVLFLWRAPAHLLICYIVTGSWVFISVLVHWIYRRAYFPSASRKYFQSALLFLAASGILWLIDSTRDIYVPILATVIFPLSMLWYMYICHHEKKRLIHKELVHLK